MTVYVYVHIHINIFNETWLERCRTFIGIKLEKALEAGEEEGVGIRECSCTLHVVLSL
jgi:hypothetical protein